MSLKEGYKKSSKVVFKAPIREKKSVVVNGIDLLENVPPRTENEVRCRVSPAAQEEPGLPVTTWKPGLFRGIFLPVANSVSSVWLACFASDLSE